MSAHPVVEKYLPDEADYSICPAALLISKFILVHRYRCHSMDCDWKGNLRVRRSSLLIR